MKTSRIKVTILTSVKSVLKTVITSMTNKDDIVPSRHNNGDIRCDWYINIPSREMVNANIVLNIY